MVEGGQPMISSNRGASTAAVKPTGPAATTRLSCPATSPWTLIDPAGLVWPFENTKPPAPLYLMSLLPSDTLFFEVNAGIKLKPSDILKSNGKAPTRMGT